jgi:carboxy-cis,cis-muconate cyclase
MRPLLPFFGWSTVASAAKHHLFVGTFSAPYLYALEFDDATHALTLTANISASSAHSWISLAHNNKALYASAIVSDSYYSYTVNNGSSLTTYGISATGMHRMAISPDGRLLYGADARANSI